MKTISKVLIGAVLALTLAGCADIALRSIISQQVALAGGQLIRVGSIASARSGPYTLDGSFMADARAKLLNTSNFGPGGTYGKLITITDTSAAITASLLSQFDVFFIGWVSDGTFSGAELSAMTTWVAGGGVMIVSADDSSHDDVATQFGFATTVNNYTVGAQTDYVIAYQAGLTHPIFKGPFGDISLATNIYLSGNVGTFPFSGSPPGLATDVALWWAVGDVPYGSGRVILLTDVDMVTNSNGDMSSGATISLSYGNEVFLGNLFAYAHK